MVVRYDNRGFGLSQKNVPDLSVDAHLSDLDAIITALASGPVDLCGYLASGHVAIEYAARTPERVSHLVLWCTSSQLLYPFSPETQKAMDLLLEADWDLYTEAFVAALRRGVGGDFDTHQFAAELRESMSPEMARAFASREPHDVHDVLSKVCTPTLLLHRRGIPAPPLDEVQRTAAAIPDARLVVLDGDSMWPYIGDVEAVVAAIEEFLAEKPAPGPAASAAPGGMVTILFTDIASSTALSQRLGDAQAQEVRRAHNSIVREALRSHGGSEIKHTGDGIMASFSSASRALECAVAVQRAVAERRDANLQVHVGLNAGEPIAEEEDLFGTAVDLARRICDHAEGAEILASNVVREIAAGKGFLFSDRGATALRGFEDPVQIWEVRWRES
jgi:class 3 adenylate cyclase